MKRLRYVPKALGGARKRLRELTEIRNGATTPNDGTSTGGGPPAGRRTRSWSFRRFVSLRKYGSRVGRNGDRARRPADGDARSQQKTTKSQKTY
ncbi:hypothetical protein EVAR_64742_1 [Eumeta japonica]|uniref:Uncharacterized protein n=1 Tax=Eumeta variegata TaxID=151549 RepID=A0A4C1Z7X1_EUMVA|nr:hypothetical protein EVAR_64742_1 [Eumeta japonica]